MQDIDLKRTKLISLDVYTWLVAEFSFEWVNSKKVDT